jgi:Transposase
MTKPIKHTENQIAEILREARMTSVSEVATKYHISETAIHAWRTKFGQSGPDDIKRLRHLNLAHARHQRFVR